MGGLGQDTKPQIAPNGEASTLLGNLLSSVCAWVNEQQNPCQALCIKVLSMQSFIRLPFLQLVAR